MPSYLVLVSNGNYRSGRVLATDLDVQVLVDAGYLRPLEVDADDSVVGLVPVLDVPDVPTRSRRRSQIPEPEVTEDVEDCPEPGDGPPDGES